jgi:hypothetical protein
MQTMFFILGALVGIAVTAGVYKYRGLREKLWQRSFDAGVLTQRVLTLETLLKDAEAAQTQRTPA